MSKAEVVARMYELGGDAPEPLGPGSKEKRSALESLGRALGLDLTSTPGKHECGRRIAAKVDIAWDSKCVSAGDTITTEGLIRLVAGVEASLGRRATPQVPQRGPNEWEGEQMGDLVDAGERSDLQQAVAEGIAALSKPGETPEEVRATSAQIDVDDVGFSDGSWMSHLLAVQAWLRLPHDLDEGSSERFMQSLADALSVSSADTDVVMPRLSARVEKAVELRDLFLEQLESAAEGDATRATASRKWVAAWDDIDEEGVAEHSGPIHAEAQTWPISQFVQYAHDEELELSPSYQRAEVWATSDSQLLIESVLRGIPLPSVILLQRSEAHGTSYEVVDGKQRLTAILRFVGRHPRAVAEVRRRSGSWSEDPDSMVRLFQDDYPTFKKRWKQHEQETLTAKVEKELHFPYPLRAGDVLALSGDLQPVRGKYYCQVRDHTVDVLGSKKRIRSIFEEMSKYQVPVITYTQVTSQQIHEVFALYNKQGKHLNAEEIRNAMYHHLALMKGLLVCAGDSADVDAVAPFLVQEWDDLSSTARTLEKYGFTSAGYKRTKILSWVASILAHGEGRLDARSTATHINDLLDRPADDRRDRLRSEDVVLDLMLLLDHGLDVHASVPKEVWTSAFMNSQGRGKWQELQLVASVAGLAAAFAHHGEALSDLVEARHAGITALARTEEWQRPEKTQSREQWQYIADVVGGILNLFGVPDHEVEEQMRERFGSTGLTSLRALRGQRLSND